jgi:hypothetical protein
VIKNITDGLRGRLQSRHLAWQLGLLAMLLCAPSLRLGLLLDDEFHRAALTHPETSVLSRSPVDLFVFIEGIETTNRLATTMGFLPWWSGEGLRIAFFRPLTGFTHWLDYELWPDLPSLMHLHSLLWLGCVVAAATLFYRRTLRIPWIAGLAALLFAVDDAHGLPAVWIANRNALIGIFFGLLTLIAHDRWRRDGWWPGALLAPFALLLGLLAKESALATVAYLAAYALFLDRGRWIVSILSLAPSVVVGTAWWIMYRKLGYGSIGSGWYFDPGADVVQFIQAVADRAPLLLAWQWLVPSDLEWALPPQTALVLSLAVLGLMAILAAFLLPLLRKDATARFFAAGMILSLLPACTAFPDDRLLLFVSIGGMGLLARFIASNLRKEDRLRIQGRWRLPALAFCALLVFIHLGLAPLGLVRTAESLDKIGHAIAKADASLASERAARFQTTLIVNSPAFALVSYGAFSRLAEGGKFPGRTLVLGSGGNPITVSRQDERTLLLRPEGGFLAPPGGAHGMGELVSLLFDQRNVILSADRLYRDRSKTEPGRKIELFGVTVEIMAVTEDGRPAEVAFRFLTKLENPYLRWMQWKAGECVPFSVPADGESMTLPALRPDSWIDL